MPTKGLKVGLEIHQQVAGKKLFCNCPAELATEDEKPNLIVKRFLRAVVGETGEIDIAAAHEQKKQKYFLYNCYDAYNCLVDIDEEPPQPINKEALETALVVAQLLHAHIVDEIQVMRKTVVDGSNTTGFQRTSLVAQNGFIEVDGRKIGVDTICLEEDSAKIVERKGDFDVYDLSRLGVPLIEIATDASIDSPELAQKVAEKIGMVLRSTGKVKRGLGTIRQDVNVSITGGQRVEIKGAQDLKLVPTIVKNEMQRQQTLLDVQKQLGKFAIEKDFIDVTPVLEKCSSKIVQNILNENGVIYGLKLDGFAGLLGKETMPGKRIGSELSMYAKAAAGVGGLFHSDELPKYGIEQEYVDLVKKKLGCGVKDGFVIIADQREKVLRALEAVYDRVLSLQHGVLKEVRNAHEDGTTSFMRPIPGASRMYPETDVMPLVADVSDLKLPKLLEESSADFVKLGLAKDLADLIAKSGKAAVFEKWIAQFSQLKPAFIAETMIPKIREVKRKYNVEIEKITDEKLEEVFAQLDKGSVPKEALDDVLLDLAKEETCDFSKYQSMNDAALENILKKIVADGKGAPLGTLMGFAMKELRGKADGKKINEILRRLIV
ncbi:Glu-tRNA(Gln) amidotransferase subunit GatE [Candidatus Woesearchaeota archaeon]|nr:Glu-tRNA(Gln) amidotransferase subunit GatE [Candidatus Woesearchaeota archaeon]